MKKRAKNERKFECRLSAIDNKQVLDMKPIDLNRLSLEEKSFIELFQEEVDKHDEDKLENQIITITGEQFDARLKEKRLQLAEARRLRKISAKVK